MKFVCSKNKAETKLESILDECFQESGNLLVMGS
jgi:hypothetical protein